MNKTKLLHVEDHYSVISGIKLFFETNYPEIEVISCRNVETAIEFIKNLDIQYAFIDLGLPKVNGIELVKYLKANNYIIKIIIHTQCCKYETYDELLKLHVDGILLKEDDNYILNQCLKSIKDGEKYYSENLHTQPHFSATLKIKSILSDTLFEIFLLLIDMKNADEISKILRKSSNTVNSQIQSIYKTFNVHKQIELIREVRKMGLI